MADSSMLMDHLNTLKLKLEAMLAAPPAPTEPAPPAPTDDQPLIDAADAVVQDMLAKLP